MRTKKNGTAFIAAAGAIVILVILVAGGIWMGQKTKKDTENAVRSVSLLYLDELAGRREEVVAKNLTDRIEDVKNALELMSEEDLSDQSHLEAYQAKMKALFKLNRFAFVDANGLVYTSFGIMDDIEDYPFDFRTINGAEIFVKDLDTPDKTVIIAIPANSVPFEKTNFVVCFMEIDMQEMLAGVSLQSQEDGVTFCNLYTSTGVALSNTVLGGLAVEDNLLEALKEADFDEGYSYEQVLEDFRSGNRRYVSFTYNGIYETLSYVPVAGTDWMLTYLIRESVISEKISSISEGMVMRSILQTVASVLVLIAIFTYLFHQNRKNSRILLEKETQEAENRVKQEEMEHRLFLQEKLLKEERQREEADRMITSLAKDYWSVYYLDLDKDEGICYRSHADLEDGFKVGDRFRYMEAVTAYADKYVTGDVREEFLRFVKPDAIRKGLAEQNVISFIYTVFRHGKESYEMVRFADVRRKEEDAGGIIRNVGACFSDVDAETRKNIEQQRELSEALEQAKQANRAKTAFLSNMSHEIRTPMNAIIGLDNIALNDPQTPESIKGYLEKIGGSAEHLLSLINDILDMSRIESGRMTLKNEEFSFQKLLEAINTMFSTQCSEKGLEYHCHVTGDVDDYYIGDTMKLRQVLINILGNAVKFTPEGGKIEWKVERTAHYERQSVIRFTISDTGIGMSKEFLPHIFDTFSQEDSSSTNRYGSSGLGLAITKNLVEMMNGEILVESEKGKGTVFYVTVTLLDSERKDSESDEREIHPREMSVLIVDDDPVACEHAKLVLEKIGIASEIAVSGKEAVEMVSLRHARREPYNLILVDWKMPEMDGVETTRKIREIVGRESAIIFLTAYRWDDVLTQALEAGVDSFLAKPLFASMVMEEFRSVMNKRNASPEKRERKAQLEGRRILLAEDIEINAEIMIMVLQARGMEADLAVNGRVAVEKFSSHPAGYYSAVLMDMRMPEMDGLEATRAIRAMEREDSRTIPIIALTANAFDEDVRRSMQAGLNAHLSKPVDPEVLYETLENLLD